MLMTTLLYSAEEEEETAGTMVPSSSAAAVATSSLDDMGDDDILEPVDDDDLLEPGGARGFNSQGFSATRLQHKRALKGWGLTAIFLSGSPSLNNYSSTYRFMICI
jgi:hypothetical protein